MWRLARRRVKLAAFRLLEIVGLFQGDANRGHVQPRILLELPSCLSILEQHHALPRCLTHEDAMLFYAVHQFPSFVKDHRVITGQYRAESVRICLEQHQFFLIGEQIRFPSMDATKSWITVLPSTFLEQGNGTIAFQGRLGAFFRRFRT